MSTRPFKGTLPIVPASAYIDETAVIVGEVVLGENVSVWPGAVIRGDVNHIHIGKDSNVQDLACLHVSHKRPEDPLGAPLVIGERVTIGHQVTLHGCTIGDECLVGIGTIVLDRAVIESHVMIGAGSLVPPNRVLRSGFLYVGRPVKEVRPLTEDEIKHFAYSAQHYVRLMHAHQESQIE